MLVFYVQCMYVWNVSVLFEDGALGPFTIPSKLIVVLLVVHVPTTTWLFGWNYRSVQARSFRHAWLFFVGRATLFISLLCLFSGAISLSLWAWAEALSGLRALVIGFSPNLKLFFFCIFLWLWWFCVVFG